MGAGGTNDRRDRTARLQELLHHMEPQLRLLRGAVVVLRALSETTDSVEPVALAALAHMTDESLEQITICWREAFDLTCGR